MHSYYFEFGSGCGVLGNVLFVILIVSRFGFEAWSWVLITSVPDLCILFTFVNLALKNQAKLHYVYVYMQFDLGLRIKLNGSMHTFILNMCLCKSGSNQHQEASHEMKYYSMPYLGTLNS